jgi:hypothetical protein
MSLEHPDATDNVNISTPVGHTLGLISVYARRGILE